MQFLVKFVRIIKLVRFKEKEKGGKNYDYWTI